MHAHFEMNATIFKGICSRARHKVLPRDLGRDTVPYKENTGEAVAVQCEDICRRNRQEIQIHAHVEMNTTIFKGIRSRVRHKVVF